MYQQPLPTDNANVSASEKVDVSYSMKWHAELIQLQCYDREISMQTIISIYEGDYFKSWYFNPWSLLWMDLPQILVHVTTKKTGNSLNI